MTRVTLALVLVGCGSVEQVDSGVDDASDTATPDTATPELFIDGPTCTGQHFLDLCGSLDRLQDDAIRCTLGAPSQCQHTAAREFIRTHNFGRCPLVVTDADAGAVRAYAAAMADFQMCLICACDLGCDFLDTPVHRHIRVPAQRAMPASKQAVICGRRCPSARTRRAKIEDF